MLASLVKLTPRILRAARAQSLMKSFRQASVLAVQRLKELAISLEHKPMEEKKDLLKKCAMTTLNSKLVSASGLLVR